MPIQYQQESPVGDVVKKETLFSGNSSVMIERGCGAAQSVIAQL